jgi:uncharacterized protein (UPF0333 family)
MKSLSNQRGQILVEYLLLMVIAIGCATLLTKQLVSRNSDSPGIIIKAWNGIISTISKDLPDCTRQTTFIESNCPE